VRRWKGEEPRSLSSRISSYPGHEITPEDVKVGKYVYTKYETVLPYAWSSGVAIGRFLRGLKNKEIWARRCWNCGRTMVPPRMYCEDCFRPTDEWVRLKDTGRIVTYSVPYVNFDASRRERPIVVAVVQIDGASPMMGLLHRMGEVAPGDVRVGMKVEAVWKGDGEREGAITDILHFRPLRKADESPEPRRGNDR
jgi:uncharacterized OB-fold protein